MADSGNSSVKSFKTSQKEHEKCISESSDNEMKRVLDLQESNFNAEKGKKNYLLTGRADGADPPLRLRSA